MTRTDDDTPRLDAPLAEVEHHLMAAYVAGAGHSLDALRARTDPAARALLAEASQYASGRLSEIEARSHYVHELHGTE
jgi:hypothetical protein